MWLSRPPLPKRIITPHLNVYCISTFLTVTWNLASLLAQKMLGRCLRSRSCSWEVGVQPIQHLIGSNPNNWGYRVADILIFTVTIPHVSGSKEVVNVTCMHVGQFSTKSCYVLATKRQREGWNCHWKLFTCYEIGQKKVVLLKALRAHWRDKNKCWVCSSPSSHIQWHMPYAFPSSFPSGCWGQLLFRVRYNMIFTCCCKCAGHRAVHVTDFHLSFPHPQPSLCFPLIPPTHPICPWIVRGQPFTSDFSVNSLRHTGDRQTEGKVLNSALAVVNFMGFAAISHTL